MRSALLLTLLLITAGCAGKQRSLVGQWSTRTDPGTGTMIFRDDNTFRSVRETPTITLILDGTYEYKGENMRMHVVKWSMPKGPKLSQEDEQEMNRQFHSDSISKVSWTDENHIRISSPQGELTTAERVSK